MHETFHFTSTSWIQILQHLTFEINHRNCLHFFCLTKPLKNYRGGLFCKQIGNLLTGSLRGKLFHFPTCSIYNLIYASRKALVWTYLLPLRGCIHPGPYTPGEGEGWRWRCPLRFSVNYWNKIENDLV